MRQSLLRTGSVLIAASIVGCSGNAMDEDLGEALSPVTGEQDLHGAPEHLHLQKGAAAPSRSGNSNPLMTWHNGTVLTTNTTHAIFWGTQWGSASFAGDKIAGMDDFFAGFGGSNYAGTSTEYNDSSGQVTKTSTYTGHDLDLTAAPTKALSVSGAVAEVCKVTSNSPDAKGVYFIFTATGAGHVSYCAWHSYGNCSNGAPVQVAYMPNIDGIAGCDPQDTYNTGHSQGLAALANVTAHELSEAITDPRNGGWYDASNGENGDKCAWSFHGPVLLSNGTRWKLQMEWSNDAFSAGTGFLNRSGQKGCLQGECTPVTCASKGANCGTISNGCGGVLQCGTCSDPQTCGGSGTLNVCGCTPASTCPAGQNCGSAPDGCGGAIDCGSCSDPETCGGGGTPNVCGT
jgi:hypothetical protein